MAWKPAHTTAEAHQFEFALPFRRAWPVRRVEKVSTVVSTGGDEFKFNGFKIELPDSGKGQDGAGEASR